MLIKLWNPIVRHDKPVWLIPLLAAGLFAAAVTAMLIGTRVRAESPQATAQRHVVVISLDGLGADWYMNPPKNLRIPILRRLMQAGTYAEGVVGVYPSVTYPSHTTIVTGRTPGEHGIYTNTSSREAGKNLGDWYWFANAIKVPTLWDVARENKLTSAAVFWPVTTGAPINWNIPEIWDPQTGMTGDPLYVAKFATPGLLFEAALEIGPPLEGESSDVTRTKLAIFILKKHRPNLLLAHLIALDDAQHEHGPFSAEATAVLEDLDSRVGEVLSGIKEAGLEGAVDVFVVSDHGFLPVERYIAPNVLLAKTGLLQADAKGAVTGGKIATVSNGGSFFIYWPESKDFSREVDAALAPLRQDGVVWGVLTNQAVKELGGEAAVRIALEPPHGAAFSSRASGEVVQALRTTVGAHGYLPFRRGLESAFIAWGPHIKEGETLQRVPMTAIGPTLLKALGVDKPDFGVSPPLEEIFR